MYTNNHQLTIRLHQFEALQMQSGYDLPRDFANRYLRGDLTGTHISSNKPIAVFSGNGRVNTKPSKSRVSVIYIVYTTPSTSRVYTKPSISRVSVIYIVYTKPSISRVSVIYIVNTKPSTSRVSVIYIIYTKPSISRVSVTSPSIDTLQDHLVEQLPSVSTWGKEYIVTPTPGRTVGEYYRIIASKPNTKVIVDRLVS